MQQKSSYYRFSAQKNSELIAKRGISFEDAIFYISTGGLIDIIAHPNPEQYPDQQIFVLNINHYIYLVPFVEETDGATFLKTIFPSRKATKFYLAKESKK